MLGQNSNYSELRDEFHDFSLILKVEELTIINDSKKSEDQIQVIYKENNTEYKSSDSMFKSIIQSNKKYFEKNPDSQLLIIVNLYDFE